MIITIDGPVGSGKSSVAKELAKYLKIYYLNTGILYRAVAYILFYKLHKTEETFVPLSEEELHLLDKISYKYQEGEPVVYFDKQNLTESLFEAKLSQAASILSSSRQIREKLLPVQREIAKKYNIVAEGRDCGSVVFPNADFKFYLTASIEVRAKRIFSDKKRTFPKMDFEKVKAELEQRDQRDKSRDIAPLIVPDGAFILDNSKMTLDETVIEFLKQIKPKQS